MPFAKDDHISKSPIEGGVEITHDEYKSALAAKLEGRESLVVDGNLVIRDPAPTPDHNWVDGAWVAPPEPEPLPPSRASINQSTAQTILANYTLADQLNVMRHEMEAMGASGREFTEMSAFIDQALTKGAAERDKLAPDEK